MNNRAARGKEMRTGFIVFLILAAATAIEWVVGKEIEPNIVPLMVIAVIKAIFILWYFMHLYRVWRSEEAH